MLKRFQKPRYRGYSPGCIARFLMSAAVLLSFVSTGIYTYTRVSTPERAYAATSSNLNYQARLLQANGALVPDGYYNIEFNLYNVGSGGSTLWTETRDYNSNSPDNRVRVVNGYFSVNLGSINALPSINWDQDLWLGLTVRGDGACSFGSCTPADSEMTPRVKLTSVPYAQAAGNVYSGNTSTASTNSNNVVVQTGNATGTTSNSGSISIDVGTATGTAGTISVGVANTSGITIGYVGVLTSVNSDLTVGSVAGSGTLFTNNGATQNATLAIADDSDGGALGGTPGSPLTAAQSVDIYTSIAINQTTAGQSISLPNPTSGVGGTGRILFVLNTGSASFTMHGVTIPSGYGQLFIWNGTNWRLAASGGGAAITLQAAYDGGNLITTSDARDLGFTLANTTTDANFLLNIATGSTGEFKVQNNGTDVLQIGAAGQLQLDTQGSGGGILLGGDVNLYRSAANTLKTDDSLTVQPATNSTTALQVLTSTGEAVLSVDTSTTTNLVANGSIEANTTGWNGKGAASIARDTNQKYIGSASLAITTTAASGDGAYFPVTLSPSTAYTLSFMYKQVTGSSGSFINIGRQEQSGTDIDCASSATLSTGWRKASCNFTTGATISSSNIYIKQNDATARTIYVDGVQLTAATINASGDGYQNAQIHLNGTVVSPTTFRNQADSERAFQIQRADGSGMLYVDTLSNIIAVNSTLGLLSGTNTALTKMYTVGSTGVNGNDVAVLANESGNARAVTSTTPRDPRILGVAQFASASNGGGQYFAINGTFTVNADATYGAISVGDQLVTSPTAGRVMADNNATTGILGHAMSALASGTGTVTVRLAIQNGQTSPYFRTNDFKIQDSTGSTNLFVVDGTNSRLAIGPAAVPANGVLTVGTNTTTASGGLYFGTDTNLYRVSAATLRTDTAFQVGGALKVANFSGPSNYGAGIATGAAGNVGLAVKGASAQTGDLFQLLDSSNTLLTAFDASGKLVFGPSGSQDTNLYRSAADTLRTDDSLVLQGSFSALRGSDYATTGNLDNVNFGAVSLVRLTGASTQNLRGVAGGSDGRLLTIVNAAAQTAYILNDDANSTAGNRILTGTGGTLTVPAGSSVILIYDSGASRWRIVGGAAAASTGAGAPFVQGGNSFGADAQLGTNDTFNLIFRTNDTDKAQLTTVGDLEFLQASTIQTNSGALTVDSATALNLGTVDATSVSISRTGVATTINGSLNVVQNFAVNTTQFTVDASNGNTDIAGSLKVGTSDAFQVDSAGSFQTTGTGYVNTNSTTAFKVEQNGVHNNTFVVDTATGLVGVGQAPNAGLSGSTLQVTGDIQGTGNFKLGTTSGTTGAITKAVTAGPTGWSAGDVVVLIDDAGTFKGSTTTTIRDGRVYGVAGSSAVAGGSSGVSITGNSNVNADTAAVAIGDQLVTSTTAGRVTVDNNATTGILGYATTSKAGGSNGTVGVRIQITTGQSSPYFRTSDFRIQDSTGATNLFRVDGSGQKIAIGPAAVPANGVLTIGTNTTTAAGGLYFGTDTNLYRQAAGVLQTDSTIRVSRAANTDLAYATLYSGNTSNPFAIRADGQLSWGDGTAGRDTNLYRSAADTLKTDDSLIVGTIPTGGTNLLCYDANNKLSTCSGAPGGGNYVQFAPSSVQTDSTTNSSIFINKTSTGNLLTLQQAGNTKFFVGNQGGVGIISGASYTPVVGSGTSALSILTGSSINAGIIVRASASQTANLLELQNSSGQGLSAFSASGALQFYNPGSTTPDTNLYRSAANVLATDDSLTLFGTSSNLTVQGTGNSSFAGTLDVTGSVAYKQGTNFSTTGNVDDVNFGEVSLVRLTGASTQTIRGIANGRDGEILTIVNAAAQAAVIANQNINSAANNRIITGTGLDVTLAPDTSITLIYDNTTSRWRVQGSAGGTSVNTIGAVDTTPTSADGARIAGNTLYLQYADATYPGLVSTGAQTLAGDKTLTGALTVDNTVDVNTNSITALKVENGGTATLTVDTANGRVAVGTAAPANGVLTVGTNTTAAAGGIYFGTDTDLYRSGAGTLATDGNFAAGGAIWANGGGVNAAWLGITGPSVFGPGLAFGSTADTNLYRSAADTLKTDDALIVQGAATINNTADINVNSTTALKVENGGTATLTVDATNGRVAIGTAAPANGVLTVGTNTTTAAGGLYFGTDVALYRNAATQLATSSEFKVVRVNATDAVFSTSYTGTSTPPFLIQADGKILWGDGTAARDTNLYRSAANVLMTDDAFTAAGLLTGQAGATISGGAISLNANSNNNTSINTGTSTGTISIGNSASTGFTLENGTGTTNLFNGNTAHTIQIGTGAAAQTLTVGSTNTTSTLTLQAGSGNINLNASQAQFSEVTGTRTLTVQTRTTNVAGTNLTISGGTAGTGASAFSGGVLTLQGGNAAGTGNANGANVVLRGGTGVGTGVSGIVEIDTPVFTASSTQSFGVNGSISQSVVDGNSTIPVNATAASLTITLPAPTNTTVGRIIYVTSVNGSNSYTISPSGGTPFVMNANMTATFVWNGSAWTNAGVDGGSASYIQNQNSVDQTANFRISGTGQANSGLLSPSLERASSGTLSVGTTANTTAISIGNTGSSFAAESNGTANLFNGNTAHTIQLGTGAAVQTVTVGSTNTTSATTVRGGSGGISLNTSYSLTSPGLSSAVHITDTSTGTMNAAVTRSAVLIDPTYSGNITDNAGAYSTVYGLQSKPTYSGTISGSDAQLSLYGGYFNPVFTGTQSNGNDNVKLIGLGVNTTSNLLAASTSYHIGLDVLASGTAAFNYGVQSSTSGATNNRAFSGAVNSSSTIAGTDAGSVLAVTDAGVVTSGTDNTYGQQLTVSRTGATGGTINTYGLHVTASGDNAGAGTSTVTGLYVDTSSSTADTTLAANVFGGRIDLNVNSNNATNINTGTSTGAINIGNTTASQATNIQGGTTGGINIGSVGATTTGSTIHIADTTNGTGVQAITMGSAGNVGNSVIIQAGSTSGVQLRADGTNAFRIQNSTGGTTIFNADVTNTRITIGGASGSLTGRNLEVANVDITTKLRIGDGTNGVNFNDSTSGKLRFIGTAQNSIGLTLSPEFPGAVLTGDGTSNVGVMTSDFCSDGLNINDGGTPNPCGTGDQHNYYSWTANANNDYDIWVKWRVPSDFASFDSTPMQFEAWSNSANHSVQVRTYKGATQCDSDSVSNAGGWSAPTTTNPTTSCSVSAGDELVFRITMTIGTGGVSGTDFVRVGEIYINYKSQF